MRIVFFTAAMAAGSFSVQAQNIGHASYYGKELAGRKTASGERFNPAGLTAAHRSLPFGTRLRLTNVSNGRTVVVRVNDRGPFVRGRAIDVSMGAAQALGFVGRGTTRLRIEPL
jgi:rare lipoprotein A